MLERAWEIAQKIGGALLLAEIVIFVMGSTHAGHLLRNSREFGQAFDEVAGSIAHEISHGAQWVAGERQ